MMDDRTISFEEHYNKNKQIVRAIVDSGHSAPTREGPKGSRDYAREFSLYMRDAYTRLPDRKPVQYQLKLIAIEKGDDAGMTEREVFQYWTPEFMEIDNG